ncbi:MAG: hypothetical protein HY888_00665 [Deltaproteobacteria bacterium]|nr:hypothetical protein [Deltaproteobacteria bacterium]
MKTENITPLVRITAVIVITLIIAFFVQAYSALHANWLRYGLKIPLETLPLPATFFHRHAFLGYVLPFAAAAGYIFHRREAGAWPVIEALLWIVIILASAWLLGCLLSWQLPLYYPTADIK